MAKIESSDDVPRLAEFLLEGDISIVEITMCTETAAAPVAGHPPAHWQFDGRRRTEIQT